MFHRQPSTDTGTEGNTGEEFSLRHHAATDLARRNFVFDVSRLEQFCGSGVAENGIAVMLTNESHLWLPSRRLSGNDREFHIHEGVTLTGALRWANGMYPLDTRGLAGTYSVEWQDYSCLEGRDGTFRWLAIEGQGRRPAH